MACNLYSVGYPVDRNAQQGAENLYRRWHLVFRINVSRYIFVVAGKGLFDLWFSVHS